MIYSKRKIECQICKKVKTIDEFEKRRIHSRFFYCISCDQTESKSELLRPKGKDFSMTRKKKRTYKSIDEGDDLVIVLKERQCLKCNQSFFSENNRICPTCKEHPVYLDETDFSMHRGAFN